MSLITDDEFMVLWIDAQKRKSDEWASVAVWNQLWSKYIFFEKDWNITQESPPESKGRRRVDVTIKSLRKGSELAVLAFHEAKALDATPQDVEDVEFQALEACMRYLGNNEGLQFVYAVTTFGTKGRAWRYFRGKDYLDPLFGSKDLAERKEYVELHSTDASLLRSAFTLMKSVPPF